MTSRTVITGIGVVAPNGIGAEAFWKATQSGLSVLDRVTRAGCEHLPLRVAGEVRGFDPGAMVEDRFLVQTDRFTHHALAAADLALEDARLGRADYEGDPFSFGVVTAAGSGGGEFGQRELQRLWEQGPHYVGPYQSIAWFYAASTGQVSIRRGLKGPCGVVASDEAAWTGRLRPRHPRHPAGQPGDARRGHRGPLAPYSIVCQLEYDGLSTLDDPERAYRPFTTQACGYVPAEGGAMFLVESETEALRRGATVRAELVATPPPSPAPGGGTPRVKDWPTRSGRRCTKRAAPPRRSTWSSPTPSEPPRPTPPRRPPSPTPSARTAARYR